MNDRLRLIAATVKKHYAALPHKVKASDIVQQNPRGVKWLKPEGSNENPKGFKWAPVNKGLFKPLEGSRLAVVLHEIRDHYGKYDSQLAQLAQQALSGAGDIGKKGDIYTQIRDRLAVHGKGEAGPMFLGQRGAGTSWAGRAREIAQSYNWHRVGAGLSLDQAVADYINKTAKDHLKTNNEQFRAAHNVFGLGSEARNKATPESRHAFMAGLRAHLMGEQTDKLSPQLAKAFKAIDYHEEHMSSLAALRYLMKKHNMTEDQARRVMILHKQHKEAKPVQGSMVGDESYGGLSEDQFSDEAILKSIRRLAQNEEHLHGVLGEHQVLKKPGIKHAAPDTNVTEVKPTSPAWYPRKSGQMDSGVGHVNPKAKASQFKRMAEARQYAIFGKKPQPKRVEGVRHDSQTQQGTHTDEGLLNTYAEYAGVRHALIAMGAIPPKTAAESRQEYDRNVQKFVNVFVAHARQHINDNPDDEVSRLYLEGAKKLHAPNEDEIEYGPGKQVRRVHLDPMGMSITGLSTAAYPLLKKVANKIGVKVRQPQFKPAPEMSNLPPDPQDQRDLLESANGSDYEAAAAKFLHALDQYGQPQVQPTKPPTDFGSQRPMYEIVDNGAHEDDFSLGTIPQEARLEGSSPDVEEIERTRTPKPRTKYDHPKIRQSIADHLAGGGNYESTVGMLKDTHGLTRAQATAQLNNYNKLKAKPQPTSVPPKPTGRVKPLGSGMRSTKRVFARDDDTGPTQPTKPSKPITAATMKPGEYPNRGLLDDDEPLPRGANHVNYQPGMQPPGDNPPNDDQKFTVNVRAPHEFNFSNRLDKELPRHLVMRHATRLAQPHAEAFGQHAGITDAAQSHKALSQHIYKAIQMHAGRSDPSVGTSVYNFTTDHPDGNKRTGRIVVNGESRKPQEYAVSAAAATRKLARGDSRPGHGLKKPEGRTYKIQPTNAQPQSDRALAASNRGARREDYPNPVIERAKALKLAQQLKLQAHAHLKAGLELDKMGKDEAKQRAWAKEDELNQQVKQLQDQHGFEENEIYGASWDNLKQLQNDAMIEHDEATSGTPRGWGMIDPSTPQGDEPIQHSAYRAPAGGVVVRGTAYKGGSMIPNMEGAFMNPPKSRMSRLAAARHSTRK